jgi:Raf kinase inhibitor-like YbhB/YbcL family protein
VLAPARPSSPVATGRRAPALARSVAIRSADVPAIPLCAIAVAAHAHGAATIATIQRLRMPASSASPMPLLSRDLCSPTEELMEILRSLARLAGRMLKPIRSGDRHLAHHRLGVEAHTISVASHSFDDGGTLPAGLTGADGRSPELRFADVPQATRELVVLVEDPDAPLPQPFVHWLVHSIPPETSELREGVTQKAPPLRQGRNSLGQKSYSGPTPPPGHGAHHYHFQVFALDQPLDVPPAPASIDRKQLIGAMRGHVIGFGERVGSVENPG